MSTPCRGKFFTLSVTPADPALFLSLPCAFGALFVFLEVKWINGVLFLSDCSSCGWRNLILWLEKPYFTVIVSALRFQVDVDKVNLEFAYLQNYVFLKPN